MARVRLEKLEKAFSDGVKAVHGIDLEIKDGELMVLVGPSGCGKSTTLRMVAGLESITEGNIWIGDRLVNDIAPKDRDIAMVFQNYALYPHMTVYKNMAWCLKLKKTPKAEIDRCVRQTAEILGLTPLLHRKPKQLSGGQMQRVAVGRAIVRSPKVFLFDEPLSNLDAKLRAQMRVELTKLHHQLKNTTIYVTHDQVEAMTMGDRICVMEAGRIKQVDTPTKLYHYPADTFVAGFIGSPAMNQTEARIAMDDQLCRIDMGDMNLKLPDPIGRQLKAYHGKEIICGIRPEHIHFRMENEAQQDRYVNVQVDLVENMGHEAFVHFTLGNNTFIARIDPSVRVRSGDRHDIWVDTRHLHLFDQKTKVNLASKPQDRT